MQFDYATKISALSKEQKVRFHERFAFNLTVVARWVCRTEGATDAEKVERLSRLSEVLRHVISKIPDCRSDEPHYSEAHLALDIEFSIGSDDILNTFIERVVETSYVAVRACPANTA